MANGMTTHVIRGTLSWAKVLGEPRMNTFTNEREWSVDVTPDKAGLAEIKRIGISKKLKEPKENDARKENYLPLRQREYRTDRKSGEKTPNQHITILDAQGQPWPANKMIGNGTVADVKFTVKDNGTAYPKGVYIKAIRVLDLVEYAIQEFAPLSEDDKFFAGEDTPTASPETASAADEPDLDDDVPF